MKMPCLRKSSKIIWKRLSRLEVKWPKDLLKLRVVEKKNDNNRYNKPWTENSKWKLTTSEEKKPILWLQVATLREKSSWWIKRLNLNNKLWKSKFMLNYGCWIMIKRFTEKKLRQQKRRRKSMRPSIFSHGKMKIR